MKKSVFISFIVSIIIMTGCSDNNPAQTSSTSTLSLNTNVDLSSDFVPMQEKSKGNCGFPNYTKPIPTTFNVYILNESTGEFQQLGNINDGSKDTFTLPADIYSVIATNYTMDKSDFSKGRSLLPSHSENLYLWGQLDNIDLSDKDTISKTITLTNDYASVMVLNNHYINKAPTLSGDDLFSNSDYYAIFSRVDKNEELSVTDARNATYTSTQNFPANIISRFRVCLETDATGKLKVQNDIFDDTVDETL